VVRDQPVIGEPKRTVGKQFLPMHILRKRSGLAQQVREE